MENRRKLAWTAIAVFVLSVFFTACQSRGNSDNALSSSPTDTALIKFDQTKFDSAKIQ